MSVHVLVQVVTIINNPGDARCVGTVNPEGAAAAVPFEAIWGYGASGPTVIATIETAIRTAMADNETPMGDTDTITVFGLPVILPLPS